MSNFSDEKKSTFNPFFLPRLLPYLPTYVLKGDACIYAYVCTYQQQLPSMVQMMLAQPYAKITAMTPESRLTENENEMAAPGCVL